MTKCPDCLKEVVEHKKKWKYRKFDVESFSCECGTDFRTYKLDGKDNFILKKSKNEKRYRKP